MKYDRADRHRAQIERLIEMADNRGVDGAQQRHRQIGDDDRRRQLPYLLVIALRRERQFRDHKVSNS